MKTKWQREVAMQYGPEPIAPDWEHKVPRCSGNKCPRYERTALTWVCERCTAGGDKPTKGAICAPAVSAMADLLTEPEDMPPTEPTS